MEENKEEQKQEQEQLVSLIDIIEATQRINGIAILTPCIHFENLSKITNSNLYLKLETFQRTKSFKFRGAYNLISTLPKGSTVVCASGGNHSHACALSCQLLGMNCIAFMPERSSKLKVDFTKYYGAEIIKAGRNFEESHKKCEEYCNEHPEFINAPHYENTLVMAGAGTIGYEIIEQVPEVDYVVVPVGGGGLAYGVVTALKGLKRNVKVIGVNTDVSPASYLAYKKAKNEEIDSHSNNNFCALEPIAEGISIIQPSNIIMPYLVKNLDDFVVVTEQEICCAISILAERGKNIAEGAGASSFAAVLFNKFPHKPDDHIVCVISGGNITLDKLSLTFDLSKDYLAEMGKVHEH